MTAAREVDTDRTRAVAPYANVSALGRLDAARHALRLVSSMGLEKARAHAWRHFSRALSTARPHPLSRTGVMLGGNGTRWATLVDELERYAR